MLDGVTEVVDTDSLRSIGVRLSWCSCMRATRRRGSASPRTATDDERAELWLEVISAYRGYDAHLRRTDRQILIVATEPR